MLSVQHIKACTAAVIQLRLQHEHLHVLARAYGNPVRHHNAATARGWGWVCMAQGPAPGAHTVTQDSLATTATRHRPSIKYNKEHLQQAAATAQGCHTMKHCNGGLWKQFQTLPPAMLWCTLQHASTATDQHCDRLCQGFEGTAIHSTPPAACNAWHCFSSIHQPVSGLQGTHDTEQLFT
jgi:hypothetical protein